MDIPGKVLELLQKPETACYIGTLLFFLHYSRQVHNPARIPLRILFHDYLIACFIFLALVGTMVMGLHSLVCRVLCPVMEIPAGLLMGFGVPWQVIRDRQRKTPGNNPVPALLLIFVSNQLMKTTVMRLHWLVFQWEQNLGKDIEERFSPVLGNAMYQRFLTEIIVRRNQLGYLKNEDLRNMSVPGTQIKHLMRHFGYTQCLREFELAADNTAQYFQDPLAEPGGGPDRVGVANQ